MNTSVKAAWMKWGMLGGLSLALVACGGQAAPEASDQPTVTTVSGKVSTWNGEGRVGIPGLPGVSSSVHGDGTFTLTLPGAAELSGATVPAAGIAAKLGCSGAVQSSAPDLQTYAVLSLEVRDSAGSHVVSAITGSKSGLLSRRVSARIWLYSDGAAQLRGTVDCAAILGLPQIPVLPVTLAVNAKPGWNVAELNIDASANILAQVSASGSLVNSSAGDSQATFRTMQEVQAQVAF